jgi:precorrin-2 dehydrogenase/sirohydrochlorin ferrochelatase
VTPLAVALVLRGRCVLVVGAGPIALGKIHRLLAAEAAVVVVAPEAVAEVHALAADGRLVLREKTFEPADLDGAFFCLTATGRDHADAAVFAACEARHLLCNAADVPEACSVYLMAQEETPPVTLAVGTHGRAPGLTGRLAREARTGWPDDIGELVARYGEIRRWLQAQHPGHAALQRRSQALRWLAKQPWPFFRQPESVLREAVLAEMN